MAEASAGENGHHGHHSRDGTHAADGHQQHPLRIYFIVWFWLFVLSFCSYMVDIMDFQGYLRWGLVLTFMVLKAGLIMAVFMHMVWERLALTLVILLPPVAVLVFVGIMAFEGNYTEATRGTFFVPYTERATPGG